MIRIITYCLKALYVSLRREKMLKWRRCLPFSELIVDRWEKASALGFTHGATIYDSSYVYGDVKVGKNTWVGPFTILDGSGGLEIGENCSISAGVQIYSHNTVKWAVTGGKARYEHQATRIGNNCFIGPQSVIRNGVTIGNNTVIGACSYVKDSIPPFSIAAGAPARIIGSIELDDVGNASMRYDAKVDGS